MHPTMMAEIAAGQIRDMQDRAAQDQRARLARRGRRAGHRVFCAGATPAARWPASCPGHHA